jgi:hypothetical protein
MQLAEYAAHLCLRSLPEPKGEADFQGRSVGAEIVVLR